MRRWLVIYILLIPVWAHAQLAGSSTYSFLNLPVSARATAMGGALYGAEKGDAALAVSNPALLGEEVHKHVAFNTGFYLAGTNFGTAVYTHYSEKIKTGFSGSVSYTTYGKFDGRDAAGNPTGDFKAGDVTLAGGFGRQWKKFSYGAQLKLIFSSIEQYNSFGIGADLSAGYYNPDKYLAVSMILRNVGAQLSTYVAGADREKLPVDLSFGVSKRFEKLPVRLSFIAHNLQRWDLTQPATGNDNQLIGGNSGPQERGFIDKLFAHIIIGAEVEAGKPVRLRLGYNHLTRLSLSTGEKKGLVGLSAGAGIVIQQFRVDYAFAKYHAAGNLNQIGISINLNEWGNKTN